MLNRTTFLAVALLCCACGALVALTWEPSKDESVDSSATGSTSQKNDVSTPRNIAPIQSTPSRNEGKTTQETVSDSQATALFEQAKSMVKQRRLNDALPLLHKAAENTQMRGPSLTLAGELLFALGNSETGEALLKSASAADPLLPRPYQLLSVWYYDIGAMDDALEQLEALSKVLPDDAKPWRMRGLILKDFERHGEAIPVYEKALEIGLPAPVEAEVKLELAESLLAGRDPQKAFDQLEGTPDSAIKHSLLAECWFSLGNADNAVEELEKCLVLEPNNSKALMLKATNQRESGSIEAATTTLEQAVAAHPADFDFRFHLMTAYNALGKKEKALEQQQEMTRLRSLRTKFTELHHKAMSQPKDGQIRKELGKTALELGRTELALSWFKAAASLSPDDEEANKLLKELQDASK